MGTRIRLRTAMLPFAAVILASLILVFNQVSKAAPRGSFITIDTVADDDVINGNCTLREAITAANTNTAIANCSAGTGLDSLVFDIPGPGPHTIQPGTELPAVSETLVIDGTTEPDFSGMPVIELDGSLIPTNTDRGLWLTSSNNVIRGLVINRFPATGIFLENSSNNIIEGNFIGTDVLGSTAFPNETYGLWISGGDNNTIGGPLPGQGNLISGNCDDGIFISTGLNILQGNKIGTDLSGLVALGNYHGIDIRSDGNMLGGTDPGAANLISGNYGNGVSFIGSNADNNLIQGNLIGVNISEILALPNSFIGIELTTGAEFNQIGGPTPGDGN